MTIKPLRSAVIRDRRACAEHARVVAALVAMNVVFLAGCVQTPLARDIRFLSIDHAGDVLLHAHDGVRTLARVPDAFAWSSDAGSPACIDYRQDGKLAVLLTDGRVLVYDLNTATKCATLVASGERAIGVAWVKRPDGVEIVTAHARSGRIECVFRDSELRRRYSLPTNVGWDGCWRRGSRVLSTNMRHLFVAGGADNNSCHDMELFELETLERVGHRCFGRNPHFTGCVVVSEERGLLPYISVRSLDGDATVVRIPARDLVDADAHAVLTGHIDFTEMKLMYGEWYIRAWSPSGRLLGMTSTKLGIHDPVVLLPGDGAAVPPGAQVVPILAPARDVPRL